jgi:tetratricopeptide (TPR) repeat protein
MKKLLLILLCLPIIGFGQGCQYGSSTDASEICDFYKGNNFSSYENADIALDKILDVTGMAKRFVLMECSDISNCIATAYKGIRYILYDRDFMDAIATKTNSWSSMSILAHEIGHHVNGHSLDLIIYATESAKAPTLSESRHMEIEADEYSGFVMFRLGASLSQAQEAIRLISTNDDDSYSTHPARDKRLRAIERGYNKAKGQGSNNDYSTNNSSLTAEDYFDRAFNNESEDYQYQINNYTRCLELDANYTPAAYLFRGDAYLSLAGIKKDSTHYLQAIFDYTTAIQSYLDLDKNESISKMISHIYYKRAGAHLNLSYNEYAIADYNSCIKLNPSWSQPYMFRGVAYYYLGNNNDAIADYSRAIRIDPDLTNAYWMRGTAKANAGLPYCSDYKRACDLGAENCCEWYNKECR